MADYLYDNDESPPQGTYLADDPEYVNLMRAVRRSPALAMPTQGGARPLQRMPTHWGSATQADPAPGYNPNATYGVYGNQRSFNGLRGTQNAAAAMPDTNIFSLPQGAVPVAGPQPPVANAQPGSALPNAVAATTQRPRPGEAGAADFKRATEEMLKASEAYAAPPDMTAAVEQYRRRAGAASDDIASAMLMQGLGGEEMAPFAGHILQRAIAARTPQEVPGGWGTISEAGFTANPYKAREAEVSRLEARAKFFEHRAQHAETLEERAWAHEQADATRRLLLEQKLATDAARNEDRDTAQNAKRTDAVRKEYNVRLDKVKQGMVFADQMVQQLASPGLQKDAMGQVAAIMTFGKMLDPDSVVREAEQQMIARARGFADTLQSLIPRIMNGALLIPKQLEQMRAIALQFQQGSRTRVTDLNDFYAGIAARNKLPVEDIIQGGTSVRPPAGAGSAGNPLRYAPPAAPAAPAPTGNVIIDNRPPPTPGATTGNVVRVEY